MGEPSCLRGLKVAIMQAPPPLARPARQGGVPSSPRLPALAPAPLPFFSSSRTWEPPGRPGNPSSGLATPRPRPAQAGLGTPPAPRVRAALAPRGAPRTFLAADPPRPVAVPARAGAAAPGGTHFVRAGAAAAPGERGVVGPERGAGAGAGGGGRRRPRAAAAAAAAAQPPRARAPIAHSHLSCSPTFPPSFFFRMEPATRARRRREETRSRSPARRHAPSCPPSPPTPAAQQKAIYMRGSDPRPDRAHPPPPALRTQAKVGAPDGAPGAGSGPAGGDAGDTARAALRSCAGPGPRPPSPLAPHTPNSSLPTPRAAPAPARSDFLPPPPLPEAPGELSRLPGRSGSSAALCRGENKTQSGLRSWLGGRGQGAESTGTELAGGEWGSGEFQGLRVPRPPSQRRSFV